jgi:hypothetical protein
VGGLRTSFDTVREGRSHAFAAAIVVSFLGQCILLFTTTLIDLLPSLQREVKRHVFEFTEYPWNLS